MNREKYLPRRDERSSVGRSEGVRQMDRGLKLSMSEPAEGYRVSLRGPAQNRGLPALSLWGTS